jgi:mRNA interferase MazF
MVYIPGQPDDLHQPRPALVVSEDIRNRLTDDVIVVPLFSTGRVGPTRLTLAKGAGGLPRSGVLFCEAVTTIDRDFLDRGPLGPRVSGPVLDAVVRAVRRALGDALPQP